MSQLVINRPPRTPDELWELVATVWGVYIPRRAVCTHAKHCAPFDAFAASYFAVHPLAPWKASRGLGGKSKMLATLGMTEMVTLRANVTILGGSGQQSQNVHKYMTEMWNAPRAPRALLATDPAATKSQLIWGNECIALTASHTSVRGPHPERQRLDEVDEMELSIYNAALGQPFSRHIPSHTVSSSTHQHADGTMTHVLQEAREKNHPIYEWCYRENMAEYRTPAGRLLQGWLTAEEVQRTRSRVSAATWLNEYEMQEPEPEGRAMLTDKVEAMWDPELGVYSGAADQLIVLEEPKEGCVYATGADWARDVDWSIITTRRVGDWKLVAWERTGRKPYPIMIGKFNERLKRYPGVAAHDCTGLGTVVDDYIEVPDGCAVQGLWLAGKTRADLFTDYVVAVENGWVGVSPRIEYVYQEHKNCRNRDLYGSGQKDHPPDSVVAEALAKWAASNLAGSAAEHVATVPRIQRQVTREAYRDPRYGD